jgi:hypothetical protein
MYNQNYVPGPVAIKVTWGMVWAFMWRSWVITLLLSIIPAIIFFILTAACGLAWGGGSLFD